VDKKGGKLLEMGEMVAAHVDFLFNFAQQILSK